MKVFTTTAFDGHYPVGTAAVIVAESVEEALKIFNLELTRLGLIQDYQLEIDDFMELDLSKPDVAILNDGNY